MNNDSRERNEFRILLAVTGIFLFVLIFGGMQIWDYTLHTFDKKGVPELVQYQAMLNGIPAYVAFFAAMVSALVNLTYVFFAQRMLREMRAQREISFQQMLSTVTKAVKEGVSASSGSSGNA